MNNPKLSVVIPAYNESKNLKNGVLDEVCDYLKKQDYPWEVLIVDDGSSDNTVETVGEIIKNKKWFRLIKNPHGGKAITVMTGVLEAKGEIVVFTDMDQATPLNQIEKFFPKFENRYDIVIGSRGGRKGAPIIRKITAWGFSFLRNIILGLPLTDTQCGFKAFSYKAAQEVFSRMMEIRKQATATGAALNAGFDAEFLFYAKKRGFKIAEVPVRWEYVESKRFNLVGDAVDAIKDMLRVRLNDFSGKYA